MCWNLELGGNEMEVFPGMHSRGFIVKAIAVMNHSSMCE